jgi:outer membrane protein TolC
LAGVDNPTIRLAEEQVREALAGQLAARSLALPSVNLGGNYRFHQGALQDDPGFLRFPRSQSLYLGAGAGTVGAGNMPVPGVWLFTNVGDAIFAPLAARQRTGVRIADAQAVRNAMLRDVATIYLDLVSAEAEVAILHTSEKEVTEIVRVTTAFANAGQGNRSDANRALANAALVRRQFHEAEGKVMAASARLCRLLSLDPTLHLYTPGGPILPIRLVGEEADSEDLVLSATRLRPELAARNSAIGEAQTFVRRERMRPWLPTISLGYSAGGFGGGSNQVATDFSPLQQRSDVTVLAWWNMQNLGFGNVARVRAANANLGQSVAGYDITLNQVRREVLGAQAACKAASRQIDAARSALDAASEGYQLEAARIKLGEGHPIETLDSFRQLLDARLDLLRATISFDVAQFQLFVALGGTPTQP